MTVKPMAASVALALGLSCAPALADTVPQDQTWGAPRALVSAAALNLRSGPSLDAEAIAILPRAWPVAVLQEAGPSLTIGGRADHWSYVATFRCADADCLSYQAGWVANAHLAYDDRFAPLEDGPAGIVSGYDARSVFAYDIEKSGAFTRWRLPCAAGSCSTAVGVAPHCEPHEELALGSVCVLSGTLHRHGDLVRGRSRQGAWLDGQDVQLVVDAAGSICPLGPAETGEAGGCARPGHVQTVDDGPAVAIAQLAAERRRSLALVAASALNLRAAPSLSAPILSRLPRASVVERGDGHGLPVILNGRRDDWVRVTVLDCGGSGGCEEDTSGWVMDSFLAYEDRLEAVTDWPRAERAGNQGFGFEVAADGTFRHWEACGTGQFGLEICSRTGRLYRYRDLYVLRDDRGDIYSAFLADAGTLCVIVSGVRREAVGACDS